MVSWGGPERVRKLQGCLLKNRTLNYVFFPPIFETKMIYFIKGKIFIHLWFNTRYPKHINDHSVPQVYDIYCIFKR